MDTNSTFDRTPYLDLPCELRARIFAAAAIVDAARVFGDTDRMRKGMEDLRALIPAVKESQRPAEMNKCAVDAFNASLRTPQLMRLAT